MYDKYKEAKGIYDEFNSDFKKYENEIKSWRDKIGKMSLEDLEQFDKNFDKMFKNLLDFAVQYGDVDNGEAVEQFYNKKQSDMRNMLIKDHARLKEKIRKAINKANGVEDASASRVPDEGEFESPYGKIKIEMGEHYIVHNDSEFTQKKKDEARWNQSISETAKGEASHLPEVYGSMTDDEKNEVYDYTIGSSKFNAVLQGYQCEHGDQYNKATFKGTEGVHYSKGTRSKIDGLTRAVGRSKLREDMWMQRGEKLAPILQMFGYDTPNGEFPNIQTEEGRKELTERFQQAIDSEEELYCPLFWSFGGAKGTGFTGSPVIINGYFPKRTEALYASPISAYDGIKGAIEEYHGEDVTKPGKFHAGCGENEFIVQRGSVYKLKKFEIKRDKYGEWRIYMDMDCVAQKPQTLPEAES